MYIYTVSIKLSDLFVKYVLVESNSSCRIILVSTVMLNNGNVAVAIMVIVANS